MPGTYPLVLVLSAAIAVVATLLLRVLSSRPAGAALFLARGQDERPRWGGAVIFLAFALTPFLAAAISPAAAELFQPRSKEFLGFLAAGSLIFMVGMFDDLRITSWQQKLAGELAAAAAVYAAGYRIDRVGFPWGPEMPLGWAGAIATVLWIVFFTNALNLIDGRDGVASGVAALGAVTLAAIAVSAHHPTVALLLVAMTGAVLGFLPWNLPPASLYIGDSGALLLGFLLGTLAIRATTGPTGAVFVAVTLVALAFPVLDTVLAMVRRLLDGRHPFLGDRDHIHHRLEESGFGPRGLLIVIWGLSALFSGAALILHFIGWFVSEALVLAVVVMLVTLILGRLGYVATLWDSKVIASVRLRLNGDERRRQTGVS